MTSVQWFFEGKMDSEKVSKRVGMGCGFYGRFRALEVVFDDGWLEGVLDDGWLEGVLDGGGLEGVLDGGGGLDDDAGDGTWT